MIQQQITLFDDGDIELWAGFNVYHSPAFHAEPHNPNTYVAASEETILEKLVLNFGKNNVNILPLLSEAAKEEVINLIKQKTGE